jgi:hypothetical protein
MDSDFFAISQNGSTNTEIACYWIEHVFDPQTKLKAGSSH